MMARNPTHFQRKKFEQHIGRKLAEARDAVSMSRDELARQLGITPKTLCMYEEGDLRISAARLAEAAHILQRDITFFFEGIEEYGSD